MVGNTVAAGNNTLQTTQQPPASADAGSSFPVTAHLPYVGFNDCGNQVRILSSGGCTGGDSTWTGNPLSCTASGDVTRTISMPPAAMTACTVTVEGKDSNVVNGYPAPMVFTVKANQSIAWSGNPASSTMVTPDYTVTAIAKTSDGVANTGMTITYSSTTPSVCTVNASSGLVHNVAVGTCTIQADAASNGNFAAKSDTRSWPVTKASQTINVTTAAPASFAYNSTFTVAATASSGLSVAITTSG
ncbi:MAG TPA: hypothetical protein PLH12_02410, partial [Pseudomonadales bacterium]|nr:hypothetical protein [Pseudomonadales bacterium]